MKLIKSLLLIIGLVACSLNLLAEERDASEPVSTQGLLLTDESPFSDEQPKEITDEETISIDNDLDPVSDNQQSSFDDSEDTEELENLESNEVIETSVSESNFEAEETTTEKIELTKPPEEELASVVGETIIVEPSTAVRIDYKSNKAIIVPYSERRLEWGKFVGLSAGKSAPEDFSSDYLNDTYDSIYGGDSSLGIELHMNFKRNYSALSLGLEINIGNYKKTSDTDLIDSSLDVTFIKIGTQLAFDNLFKNQSYVVPYFSGGIYQILYKEEQSGVSNNGTTQVSFYGSGGLMFDIDWLDPLSARDAYFESGIENTFLFAEATYMSEPTSDKDPNFSGLDVKAGLKTEF